MASFGARSATSVIAIMAVITMAGLPHAESKITCPQVYGALNLCIGYLRNGGTPPPACCGAARSELAAARTVQDRRTACTCLRTAAAGVTGLKITNAVALAPKCGIFFPYKITPNIDCSRIN